MKNSTATVTLLSVIAALLFGASSFAIYRITKDRQEIRALITNANEIEKKQILAGSIRNIQNIAKDDLATLEKASIADGTIVNVIEKIENTGRAMNLDITTKSVDKEGEATDNAQKIRIALSTSGSWARTFDFLSALENLPTRVSFESVNLHEGDSTWDAAITLALYNFK